MILVTAGAGYIGSHTCLALLAAGCFRAECAFEAIRHAGDFYG